MASRMAGDCKCPPIPNGPGCACQDTLTLAAPGLSESDFDFQSETSDFESYFTYTYNASTGKLKIMKSNYAGAIQGQVFAVYVHISPSNLIYSFNVQVKPAGIKLVGPPRD